MSITEFALWSLVAVAAYDVWAGIIRPCLAGTGQPDSDSPED